MYSFFPFLWTEMLFRCQHLPILCIPYIGNHPQMKSFVNYLLRHSWRENFCDSGKLIYKNSGQDKKCKKKFANASTFTKFVNISFMYDSQYTVLLIRGVPIIGSVKISATDMVNLSKCIFSRSPAVGPIAK